MLSKEISRRSLVSCVASAGPLLVSSSTAFAFQANSAVGFGIIGTGGRGRYVGGLMANDSNARLAAICDLYADRIDLAKTQVKGADKVPAYKDYHELLADRNIDAVLISTPVFLHPEMYEAAILARKHIYCEKPAGADLAGVKRMLAAHEKRDQSKRIQFGFQQRFSTEYRKAHEYLEAGRIGEMKLMMSYWVLGNLPPVAKPGAVPPVETEAEKIRKWGSWMKYSGGPIVEQDCHGIDTINWFAGDPHPLSAAARGGLRYPLAYGDWIADHYDVAYTYPNGLDGWLISIKHTAGYRDVREQFFGSKGLLETSRKYFALHGMTPNAKLKSDDDLRDTSLVEKQESVSDITGEATASFFKGILSGDALDMTLTSCNSTLTAILGRMAIQTQREVTWDEMLRST